MSARTGIVAFTPLPRFAIAAACTLAGCSADPLDPPTATEATTIPVNPTTSTASSTSDSVPTTTAELPDPTTSTSGDTTTGDIPDTTTDEATTGEPDRLCEDLGGIAGATAVAKRLLELNYLDNRINAYFLNSDVDGSALETQWGLHLAAAAGCPDGTLADLATIHQDLGISRQDFTDLLVNLTTALDQHEATHPQFDIKAREQLLTVIAADEAAIVEDPDNNLSLYQRLGRKPGLRSLVGNDNDFATFLGRVADDDAINGFFVDTDYTRLRTCLVRQFSSFDGPAVYGAEVDTPGPGVDDGVSADDPCRDMFASHHELLDPQANPITYDDFTAFATHLVTAMTTVNIPHTDQVALLAYLDPLCDAIVVGTTERNRCPHNHFAQEVVITDQDTPLEDGMYDGTLETTICFQHMFAEDPDGLNFVGDIEFRVGIDHTWLGDLTIKLESPKGTLLTLLSRAGPVMLPDDGTGCCGDDSNLNSEFPITFRDSAFIMAHAMGATIGDHQVVCKDDNQCAFKPAPAAGPGTDFTDFRGEDVAGTWWVCVGDSTKGDGGVVNNLSLTIDRLRYDPNQ